MPSDERGDERAHRDHTESRTSRIIESRTREHVSDSLSFQRVRHFRMYEDDPSGLAAILSYRGETVDLHLESMCFLVVPDGMLIDVSAYLDFRSSMLPFTVSISISRPPRPIVPSARRGPKRPESCTG